jgi:uncharacterized protein YlzI (FlbEa/FlbD family)
MKMVRLTLKSNGKINGRPIYVNPYNVCTVYEYDDDCTCIAFGPEDDFLCYESVDVVVHRLENALNN